MPCDDERCRQVWRKGLLAPPNDPADWRKDACGAWIRFRDYGEYTEYGWTIDHITPEADGGSDHISNLQPLHFKNNMAKSDRSLECPVKADGSRNSGWR